MKKASALNQIIANISPSWALKRETARQKFEVFSLGYTRHGASQTKKSLLGWLFKAGSPDEDITKPGPVLVARSRDLYYGTPLAAGAIKTRRTNIIGPGLQLKPQVDAEFLRLTPEEATALEKTIKREFYLWADSLDCDIERRKNFGQMQALAFMSVDLSGDCFALLPLVSRPGSPYDLRVRLIEADRVCNPYNKIDPQEKILAGVEIGEYGEPIACHIAQKHPGSTRAAINTWVRVLFFGEKTGRRNVLHLMEQERPEQRRGVPLLAPVIESLKQLGRYTDAELMAAVVSAFLTVFIESDAPDSPIQSPIPPEEKVDDDENSIELGNGAVIALRPGEKANTTNPGRPNQAFDGFVVAICRQIGAALEMPYEVLVKHFTSSYSASRGALLEFWKMIRMRRAWFAANFCQPIYEEWLTEAVAKGRIRAPGFFRDPAIRKAYCGADWNGPTQGQLDPLKEVNAAKVRVEEDFSTRAKEAAEFSGTDYDVIIQDRSYEERVRRENGLVYENKTVNVGGGNNARTNDEDDEE